MGRKPIEGYRYRLTVPNADQDVINWIKCQDNVSVSLRVLIQEAVGRYGMKDVFCNRSVHMGLMGSRFAAVQAAQPDGGTVFEPVQREANVSAPPAPAAPAPVQQVQPKASTAPVQTAQPDSAPKAPVDENGFVDPMAFMNQ